ncbi:MAG: chorismate-binding protein, partial [Cytophagales bacterium]|nr:chorismate-binding protein [Cytophagales bacterium]
MNYSEDTFPISDSFKIKALVWAEGFENFTFLDDNNILYPEGAFPQVLAVGGKNQEVKDVETLTQMISNHGNWMFGFFSFDMKNMLENLQSKNLDLFNIPNYHFYLPETLVFFTSDIVKIITLHLPFDIYKEISNKEIPEKKNLPAVELRQRVSKPDYLETVEKIKNHIYQGDIYEMNYCIEFFAENVTIDPLFTYLRLNDISPMPFSAFGKFGSIYAICASPERFIKKNGQKIVSQPIKGTIKRGKTPEEDDQLHQLLANSQKERSENIMIVDLVRNDLSRTAIPGSVQVNELCKIYSFASVHQMISTIESKLSNEFSNWDAICHAFPMGSMTGAPKINALKLIDT